MAALDLLSSRIEETLPALLIFVLFRRCVSGPCRFVVSKASSLLLPRTTMSSSSFCGWEDREKKKKKKKGSLFVRSVFGRTSSALAATLLLSYADDVWRHRVQLVSSSYCEANMTPRALGIVAACALVCLLSTTRLSVSMSSLTTLLCVKEHSVAMSGLSLVTTLLARSSEKNTLSKNVVFVVTAFVSGRHSLACTRSASAALCVLCTTFALVRTSSLLFRSFVSCCTGRRIRVKKALTLKTERS